VKKKNHHLKNRILKPIHREKGQVMGMFNLYLDNITFISLFLSYANLGIDKDPPYAYKDKTDNYEASLDAQRVRT